MRQVISIAQREGGVGKTTLAVCLAAELRARGRKVALVDSDPQCSASHWAEPGNLDFPVYEIVLGEQSVSAWVQEVMRVAAEHIVIDTAPNDRALGAAIAVSDLVLIPCTPSGLDLDATVRTLEIVDTVRARRNGIPYLILVPNRVDARTLEGQQLSDELAAFGERVSAPIGNRTAFPRAFSSGRTVADIAAGQLAQDEIRALGGVVETSLAAVRSGKGM